MSEQQTAVEWIEYQVQQQGITHYFSLKEILEQGKEMEKMCYTEFEVLQLLLKLQQTESYDSLYDWFQENKKQTHGGNK
jgi:hypothetical protein